jgi:hypothetical protein
MGDIPAVGKERLQSLAAFEEDTLAAVDKAGLHTLAALALAAVDKAELHTLAAGAALAAADKVELQNLAVAAAPAAVFENLEG